MKAANRQRNRRRREERQRVEAVLAAHGLAADGPRVVRPEVGGDDDTVERLGTACAELGGTWAAFAAYLATRPDLLPAPDCRTLEEAAAEATAEGDAEGDAVDTAALEALIATELGAPPDELFAAWEPLPFATAWPLSQHRAATADGTPLRLWLVAPGAEERAAADLELLPLLAAPLAHLGLPAAGLVDDFRRSLSARFDLRAAARSCTAHATDVALPPELVPAELRPELCAARVLAAAEPGAAGDGATSARELAGTPRAAVVARRAAVAWLALAVDGVAYPLDLDDDGVLALDGGRVGFQAASWARPPAVLREPLARYLDAARRHDPEAACAALLEVLEPMRPGADREALLLALRQAVPFRDGAWSRGGDSLAEHLFLHWRAARSCGYAPRSGLADFQRGFTALAAVLRRLDPAAEPGVDAGADPLAEAVDDLGLRRTMAGVHRTLAPSRMSEEMERYADLMVQLPERLDAVLRRAAGGPPAADHDRRAAGGDRGADRATLLLTFVVAAVAALLLVRNLEAAGQAAAEPVAVAVLLVLGLLVLRRLDGGGR